MRFRHLAQAPTLQMNVMYECQPPYSFKFFSCTGTGPNDECDVQSFRAGQPFQRGKSTDHSDRVQVRVNGRWMEGKVRGQNLNMYNIRVPGVDTGFGSDIVDTTPENIRM